MDQAEELVDRFAAGIDDLDAPAPHAALMTCRAIVAEAEDDHEKAAEQFAEAAAAWGVLPRPYDELLALERQGLSLLAAGARDDGLGVLTDAEQRPRQLGATWDADRIAHLLHQHDVEVSRAWKRGPRGYGEQLSQARAGSTSAGRPSSRTAAAMAAVEAGLIAADDDSPAVN